MNPLRNVSSYTFDPSTFIAGVLVVIAWIIGEISGILAWILLLLTIKITFTWKLKRKGSIHVR